MTGVLVGRGVPVAPDTIANAPKAASTNGSLDPRLTYYLMGYAGFLPDQSETFQKIANEAMIAHGLQPQPVVAPIRNLQRWQAAGQSYQRLGQTLQDEAAAEGDKDLAVTIARIRALTSATAKQAVAQQLEASRAGDPVASARAKRLLVPELLRGQ